MANEYIDSGPDSKVVRALTPEEEQALADKRARNIVEIDATNAETAKTDSFGSDPDASSFWNNVDTMSKDEFKQFVFNYVFDLSSARNAIVRLGIEVARLRRIVGK